VEPVRPRVLAVLPGLFPSTVVNVAKPLLRLHETAAIDLELSFQFAVRRRQIERADVLVMCHTIDPAHGWILDAARESGTPLLYDIDENLFEPPAGVSGLDYQRAPGRKAALQQCLRQASLVRTYAPALKRYLDPFNAHVVRVDGPIDWRLVPDDPPSRSADRVRVVYATSRLQDSVGVTLVAPLRRVLAEHTGVEVTIWGPRLAGLDGHPRVRSRELVRDYDRYFEQFAREGFDVGLAPMPDDLFHQCKTATKFREYAACHIAGIYSDTEIYRDCVADGETGLLAAPHEDAWVAAMSRVIRDAALRRSIQERAYAQARDRYAPDRMERQWLAHINEVRQPAVQDVRPDLRARQVSAAPVAIAAGIARQTLRYASRVPALLRSGGLKDVWARTCAQLAGFRQLMAWELTLWRLHRHRSRMP
jgi:hypothetical protein